jgi:hypothetical protein
MSDVSTRTSIIISSRRWARFALCAVIINVSALALIWAWRESATKPPVARAVRTSTESDAIQIRLAPNSHGEAEELPKPPEADLAVRSIESELADLGQAHAWAGKYFDCSELGGHRELLIAPNAGFAIAYPGELGTAGTMFGSVHEANGWLELVLAPNSTDGIDDAPGFPTILVPVAWSGRRELIEPRYWQRWSNFAKREWPGEYETQNFEHGSFWLRSGDEWGAHTGASWPPAEYLHAWMTRVPIHVTAVGKEQRTFGIDTTSVELDAGAREGMSIGTRLFVDELPDLDRPVRVISVREHACTAELEQSSEDARVPLVGWTCSSLPKLE